MSGSQKRPPELSDRSILPTQFSLHERCAPPAPHFLECEVQRVLLSEPQYQFASLVIRRTTNGICLQGVLITDDDARDVGELLRTACGVEDVINRLVVCRADTAAVLS